MIGTSSPQLAAHVRTVAVRQSEVEQDEVGPLCRERVVRGSDAAYHEAVPFEARHQRLRNGVVVLYQQHVHVSSVARSQAGSRVLSQIFAGPRIPVGTRFRTVALYRRRIGSRGKP